MVIASKKTRKSASVLQDRLEELGYEGRPINWGFSGSSRADTINRPEALKLAVNKRLSLEALDSAGVSTLLVDETDYPSFPILGRPDSHSMGRWFYVCNSPWEVRRAKRHSRHPATHFQKYLVDFREFRVHIVDNHSIKISEKFGGGNYHNGGVFAYPQDFQNLTQIRTLAKDAVSVLGLDFGAVDILWKDTGYVLEVNTAPRLTDDLSDTLERYAQAFMRSYDETM